MTMMPAYTPPQHQRIVQIARASVAAALLDQPHEPAVSPGEEYLREPRGCFVSLHHRRGHLRGCVGTFAADRALAHAIADVARSVIRDPRFHDDPVTLEELEDLLVEVSVLTPMQHISNPLKLRLGVDGIHIRGKRLGRTVSGCLLPQVAVEQGWTVEQTLSYCCRHKMGLHGEAWRPPTSLEFHVFQSTIVAERTIHA